MLKLKGYTDTQRDRMGVEGIMMGYYGQGVHTKILEMCTVWGYRAFAGCDAFLYARPRATSTRDEQLVVFLF